MGVAAVVVANVGFQTLQQWNAKIVGWNSPIGKATIVSTTAIELAVPCLFLAKLLHSSVERACSWQHERQRKALFAEWKEREGNTPQADKAIDRIISAYLNQETTLDLSDLNLRTLPLQLRELTQLKELYLSGNPLNAFPQVLCSLTSLELLALENCNIDSVPTETENLTQLKMLGLSNNPLGAFPKVLCSLTSLERLSLANCNIDSVPTKIENLIQLIELNLIGNGFSSLPHEIAQLTNLQNLWLANNPNLKTIPMKLVHPFKCRFLILKNLSPLPKLQAQAIKTALKKNAKGEALENSQSEQDLWQKYDKENELDFHSWLEELPLIDQRAFTELLKRIDGLQTRKLHSLLRQAMPESLDLNDEAALLAVRHLINNLLEERLVQRPRPRKSARNQPSPPHDSLPS